MFYLNISVFISYALKCIAQHILIKKLVPKIKLKLNIKKTNSPILKMGEDLNSFTSWRKICRWQVSIWKDALNHMSLENCKWKQQWDTRTHQSGTLTAPNAGEDVEQQELHSLLVGMHKGAATLEDSLAVPYQTKYDPASTLLGIYPKEVKA